MTVRDFGERKSRRRWIPLVVSGLAAAGALGALLFVGLDLAAFERANGVMPAPTREEAERFAPRARAEWRIARAHLESRLHQTAPLELGAVWATRAGRICGLVNGPGSFGGLTAMTRFYTVDQRPVFHQDIDHLAFQRAWFQCRRDRYVTLHEGTSEPGFCGTALGKRRCYWVKNGARVEAPR